MQVKSPRAYIRDTSVPASGNKPAFLMVDYQLDDKAKYGQIISKSKFVLCPRGYASSTWRLFETMKAGRVPVIISDQWVAPEGPQWETFSLRIKEKEIAAIPELLESCEMQAEMMAQRARQAWDEWFSRETVFHRMVDWCLMLKSRSQCSTIKSKLPYLQLLRPFFIRHIILREIKKRVHVSVRSR
jgi:hypothetical protein